jgi:diguanylate cyclase (GGDEF)-like protein
MPSDLNPLDRDASPLILLIDDDPECVTLLRHMLSIGGYRVMSADDGRVGIVVADKFRPDLIILDLDMPEMDGFEVGAALKHRPNTAAIPLIFGTGTIESEEMVTKCLAAGAEDLLFKPYDRMRVLTRVRVVLRSGAARAELERRATRDRLTGLANREQFMEDLAGAIRSAHGDGSESVVVLSNINGLQRANQRYGFDFGDELIITFSRLLKRLETPECRAARIGGGMFGLVLGHARRDRGVDLAQRLGQTFSSVVFDAASEAKQFGAHFGLAAYAGEPADLETDTFFYHADVALFAAKRKGPNQVVAYWTIDPAELPNLIPHPRHSRSQARRPTQRAFVGLPEEEDPTGSPPRSNQSAGEAPTTSH